MTTKLLRISCVAIFLVSAGFTNANADGVFQIGPQFGYSDFDISPSAYGTDLGDYDMQGASVGLVARYTVPVGGNGMFVGLQAGFSKEFASEKDTLSDTVTVGGYAVMGTVTGKTSANWGADIMPRIGYVFNDLSLSLAAGLSFVQGKFSLSGSGAVTGPGIDGPLVLSDKDTQWHRGWKIAPGIDYQLSEDVTLFGQVYYARYKAQTYTVSGVSVKGKPEMRGVRVGILLGF